MAIAVGKHWKIMLARQSQAGRLDLPLQKKPSICWVFNEVQSETRLQYQKRINVLRTVDVYVLCVDPLSYVQRDVRHV